MMEKLQPSLRFPEFKEDWKNDLLGNICDVSSGGTPNRTKKEYWNGDIPWVSTTLIDFNVINKTDETITELGLKNSSAKIFPLGTILMAMYGQGKTRGKVSILGINASTNQACGAILPNYNIIDNIYLFQNLAKRYDEIRDLSNQGGQENLSGGIIKGLKINFPSLPEQQKIASFLTAVDEKLALLKEKKNKLEQYKKGVMQKIFSQELRFKDQEGNEYPEWEEKRLGEMCKITTGKLDANAMVENGKYRFYTCAKNHFFIDEYAFDTEALLISGNGANVGYIHYYNGKFNAYQRTYILFDFDDYVFYLQYYLEQYLQRRIKSEKNEGNTPYIVLSTLYDMKINLPCLEEQTKIAEFLSAIDEKIVVLEKQIQHTEEYKKGLLQGMFC